MELAAGISPEIQALPSLREDIRLFPGAEEDDGSPAWVLHDPSRNRFFRIGWVEFELLRCWHLIEPAKVIDQVNHNTPVRVNETHVRDLISFLALNQLVVGQGSTYLQQLNDIAEQAKQGAANWLLHHYLFLRIPLVRPDRFLRATYPLVKPLYSASFFRVLFFFTLLGLFLISRQWDQFTTTFLHFYTLEGLLLFAVAISISKIVHELGHAYTATRFGLKVPTMGVAFLVLWPVLYTESSEAWKLAGKRQRLLIAGAGMMAELCLAALAALLWNFLDDSPMRSAVFMLATSTWVVTLLINLNPFMRFDGYYLLSDMLDFPNLQDRSFALARWRMRELLFGLGLPAPEQCKPGLQRLLIYYAWGTWIYRLLLFLGIAVLVYFLFFKILGLFLMLVEIIWFIGRPIYRELLEWRRLGGEMRWNRHIGVSFVVLMFGIGVLVIPWRSHLYLPGILMHAQQSRIYVVEAGRLDRVNVAEGDRVQRGQVLFRLVSPDLEHRLGQAKREVEILSLELQRKATTESYLEYSGLLEEQLAEATSAWMGLREQSARLEVRAKIDGQVVFLDEGLTIGRWLDNRTLLARIVQPQQIEIQAYINGKDVSSVLPHARAVFYPEDSLLPNMELQLRILEKSNTHFLPTAYLASDYAGPLATRIDGAGRIVSEKTLFRIQFEPLKLEERWLKLEPQVVRGEVRIEASGQSLMKRVLGNVTSILIRESGF